MHQGVMAGNVLRIAMKMYHRALGQFRIAVQTRRHKPSMQSRTIGALKHHILIRLLIARGRVAIIHRIGIIKCLLRTRTQQQAQSHHAQHAAHILVHRFHVSPS